MNTQSKGFSITALVLGIVSVCTGIIFYFSIPSGVVAIIFAALSLKKKLPGRGMALAGLITAIVGVSFGLLILILAVIGYIAGAGKTPTTV